MDPVFPQRMLFAVIVTGRDRPPWPDCSLLLDRATRALAGTRIGTGALTAQRQAAAVAQATVRTEVDQALDGHADFAAEVALDAELGDLMAQLVDFRLGQVLDFGGRIDTGVGEDLLRARTTDAKNALQADHDMLLNRQIDTRNACHA